MAKYTLTFTRDEIDAIVRAGDHLYQMDGSFDTRSDFEFPTIVGDWELRWVGTNGVGNDGRLVAIPRSNRARQIWRDGRVAELSRKFGGRFTTEQLTAYVRHSQKLPYVWEPAVAEFTLSHQDMPREHLEQLRATKSPRRALERLGYPNQLSHWRLLSALEMIQRLDQAGRS